MPWRQQPESKDYPVQPTVCKKGIFNGPLICFLSWKQTLGQSEEWAGEQLRVPAEGACAPCPSEDQRGASHDFLLEETHDATKLSEADAFVNLSVSPQKNNVQESDHEMTPGSTGHYFTR